jgi:hypothetical protein
LPDGKCDVQENQTEEEKSSDHPYDVRTYGEEYSKENQEVNQDK